MPEAYFIDAPAADIHADASSGTRVSERVQTTFRIARVVAEADEGLARLRDISDHGAGLRLYMPVLLGDSLMVQLGDTAFITGRVVWTREADCGIKLDEEVDSALLLAELAREGQRAAARPLRLSVATTAIARCDHGILPVELVDVSLRGLKLRHDGSLIKGLSVKVTLPSGTEARGIVRWSSNDLAGLMLLEPFSVKCLGSVRNL